MLYEGTPWGYPDGRLRIVKNASGPQWWVSSQHPESLGRVLFVTVHDELLVWMKRDASPQPGAQGANLGLMLRPLGWLLWMISSFRAVLTSSLFIPDAI